MDHDEEIRRTTPEPRLRPSTHYGQPELAFLDELRKIEEDLHTISDLHAGTPVASDQLRAALQQASESTFRLKLLIHDKYRADRGAARKVFDVAELTEMILSFLPAGCLLVVACVSRLFATSIARSAKLQRNLCLRPELSAFWSSPFHDIDGSSGPGLPGVSCNFKYNDPYMQDPSVHERPRNITKVKGKDACSIECIFHHTNMVSATGLPVIGTTPGAMLICQPPVLWMMAELNCCSWRTNRLPSHMRYNSHHGYQAVIRSDTGITFGDLFDVAERLCKKHDHCGFVTSPELHTRLGAVKVRVKFHGVLWLREDDPHWVMAPGGRLGRILYDVNVHPNTVPRAFGDYITTKKSGEFNDTQCNEEPC